MFINIKGIPLSWVVEVSNREDGGQWDYIGSNSGSIGEARNKFYRPLSSRIKRITIYKENPLGHDFCPVPSQSHRFDATSFRRASASSGCGIRTMDGNGIVLSFH